MGQLQSFGFPPGTGFMIVNGPLEPLGSRAWGTLSTRSFRLPKARQTTVSPGEVDLLASSLVSHSVSISSTEDNRSSV